jgi:ADP-ribose pyrophosphatase YjhB (NUDIX family)
MYQQIRENMPISCVDLVIEDPLGQILLLKRINTPAQGQWWFPGGRILFGETRIDAARRKLREECGLEAAEFVEAGTFDLLLPIGEDRLSHTITTVFATRVDGRVETKLDQQSSAWRWVLPDDRSNETLHPFVSRCIGKRMNF